MEKRGQSLHKQLLLGYLSMRKIPQVGAHEIELLSACRRVYPV